MSAAASRCPSDLALEGHLLQPARSPVAHHLDGCSRCRARVARMQEEGEEFRRRVFPATVDAVEQAATSAWRARWRRLLAPVAVLTTLGALGAAALLVVRAGPAVPRADYVGEKGAAALPARGAGLRVFMSTPDGARQVEDGAVVPADAALRFSVRPEGRCFLWIASVDATGQISRLYPPEGAAPAEVPAGPVPGGALLDGRPGLERLFALCADGERVSWDDVRRAATPAARGPQALRATATLAAPLDAASQSSLLLDKR